MIKLAIRGLEELVTALVRIKYYVEDCGFGWHSPV
jgi:hypothetical protein